MEKWFYYKGYKIARIARIRKAWICVVYDYVVWVNQHPVYRTANEGEAIELVQELLRARDKYQQEKEKWKIDK